MERVLACNGKCSISWLNGGRVGIYNELNVAGVFTDLKIACGRCVVHELSEFVSTLLMGGTLQKRHNRVNDVDLRRNKRLHWPISVTP